MKIIDADKLHYKQVYIQTEKGLRPALVVFAKEIRKMPEIPKLKVKVDPVRPGRWIRNDNGTYSCSECKSWIPNEQYYYARYCLHCGARMGEVENADT